MRQVNWKPGQSAELSTLGEGTCAGPGRHPVRILEFSGKQMRLAGMRVKSGTAVRLDWDGQLALGKVLNTEPEGFWIEVHHLLLDTAGPNGQKNFWPPIQP